MIEDIQLTDHFSLAELSKTSWSQYQDENRELTPEQIMKLGDLARLLEHVRYVLSVPLLITSGYRCPSLNKAVGSLPTSQHILCEAADFIPMGLDLDKAFEWLKDDVTEKKANVGQLIYETAPRPGGFMSWIHISLGVPYRPADKVKEILSMTNGIYTRLA